MSLNSGVYNPWSVISSVSDGVALRQYWIDSGDDRLFRRVILNTSIPYLYPKWMALLGMQSINACLIDRVSMRDLGREENVLWSMLLHSGYLTTCDSSDEAESVHLRIPNLEVKMALQAWVRTMLAGLVSESLSAIAMMLRGRNLEGFFKRLGEFLRRSASYRDFSTKTPERSYHLFMLGVLSNCDDLFTVDSETVSGYGDVDLVVVPNSAKFGWERLPTYLFELKRVSEESQLSKKLDAACAQIESRDYGARFVGRGFREVYGVGVVFFKTRVVHRSMRLSPSERDLGAGIAGRGIFSGGGGGGGEPLSVGLGKRSVSRRM